MKVIVNKAYDRLSDYISSIPDVFGESGIEIYHKRNIVKILRHNETDLVVKRYKRPNLIQRVAYSTFCSGKAMRAYSFAMRMLEMGISTPAPIAYIEIKKSGLLSDSYFISERTYDLPLFPLLVETQDFDRTLAREVARFIASLHEKGVLHGDPNLTNILYHADGESQRFTLIDTNRTKFGTPVSKKECMANIMRLTHRRDLLGFIAREYALLRGWDTRKTETKVLEMLSRFERRRERKYKLKRLLLPFKRK